MNDAFDDKQLTPSELDMARLNEIEADGRVIAENDTWTIFRYPPKPIDPDWKQWAMILTGGHIQSSGLIEKSTLEELISELNRLEAVRKKATRGEA